MLRIITALLLGGTTTLGIFWLMLSMTSANPGPGRARSLTAIDFVRLPDRPEPPPPRSETPEPMQPPEEVPEFALVAPRPPPLQLSRLRIPGLSVPALSSTQDILGIPFLGSEPAAVPRDNGLRILKRFPPLYPARALMRKTEGWVRLELTIDPEGRVAEARVMQADPRGVFDRAALKAARRWRFESPAQRERERAVRVTQKIEFKLER